MKENKIEREEIIKTGIPNEDMPGWIQSLREGGFTDEEMDIFLSNLNAEYRKIKNPNFIDEKLDELIEYIKKRYKKTLNSEQIKYLRKGIESQLKED